MASDKKILMFATFSDPATAKYVRETLPKTAAADNVEVDDVAQIDREITGKVNLEGAGSSSLGDNMKKGGIAGAVFGLIFPPSIIGTALIGAGIGAVTSKLRETAFKQDELLELGDTLQPGQSAILLLGDESNRDFYQRYLSTASAVQERAFQANMADLFGAER